MKKCTGDDLVIAGRRSRNIPGYWQDDFKPTPIFVKENPFIAYQFYAEIGDAAPDKTQVFLAVILATCKWLIKRYGGQPLPAELDKFNDIESISDFGQLQSVRSQGGNIVDILTIDDKDDLQWILHFSEPDPGTIFRDPEPGCMFETNISYRLKGGRVLCGMRTVAIQSKAKKYNHVEVHRPLLLKEIRDRFGMKHVHPIQYEPVHVRNSSELESYLTADEQALPVVVVREPDPYASKRRKITASELAESLFTFAHVLVVPYDLTGTDFHDYEYCPPTGGCIEYFSQECVSMVKPKDIIKLKSFNLVDSRIFIRDKQGNKRPTYFRRDVSGYEALPFILLDDMINYHIERNNSVYYIDSDLNDVLFYKTAYNRELLRAGDATAAYQLLEEYDSDITELKAKNADLKGENARLQAQVDRFNKSAMSASQIIPWAVNFLGEYIEFSKEAEESLEEAIKNHTLDTPEQIDRLCKGLLMIAAWVMLNRKLITKEAFEAICPDHEKCTPCMSGNIKDSKISEAYKADGIVTDWHIKWNSMPNSSNKPRIYFGWNKKNDKARVGFMWTHLKTWGG